MISPPNDLKRAAFLLYGLLEGSYTLEFVHDALAPHLVFDFHQHETQREILRNDFEGLIEIPVEARHVRQMVQRYLAGAISDSALSDWSAFVFLTGLFVPEGTTEDERQRAGEGPVWDILQRLMSPSVFDGLDPIVAREYVAMLA